MNIVNGIIKIQKSFSLQSLNGAIKAQLSVARRWNRIPVCAGMKIDCLAVLPAAESESPRQLIIFECRHK